MTLAGGFPAGVEFTPVPNPVLSSYLAEVDDLAELKVLLRALWRLHHKKGSPKPLSPAEIWSDPTMALALGASGAALERSVASALDNIAGRGIFIRASSGGATVYFLNTAPERRAVAAAHPEPTEGSPPEAWPSLRERPAPHSPFAAYEDNIGPLTPVIVAKLEEAQSAYPQDWLIEAIGLAAERNARSWRYIEAVLTSWAAEGRPHGESRRNTEALQPDDFIEAYWERQRRRGAR